MKNMSLSSKIMVLMLQLDIKIITITIILLKIENPGKKTKAMHNLSVKLRLTWWYLNQSLYKAHHLLPRRFIVMTAKKTHWSLFQRTQNSAKHCKSNLELV